MNRRRARQGITLLEMLIALALIGIMSSIVWPAASSALEGIRLRSSADSVASLLAQAALRVERRQQPVEIVIDIEKSRLEVIGVSVSDRRELELDPGIRVAGVEPRLLVDEGGDEEQPAERRFVLMPGSGWPAIRVELANQRNARRVVRLDPITGAPEVQIPRENGEETR